MLLRILAIGLLNLGLFFSAQMASAAAKYGAAGCGLGSIVMGPKGSQVSAYTTNGTGIQTFGISSGTSNCLPASKHAAMMRQEKFVSANLATLSKEAAQGAGQTLSAFSEVFGCASDSFTVFATELQSQHAQIFGQPGSMAVLDATTAKLKSHPVLSKQCQELI